MRLPAGWCGLVGFKPSLGRIPIDPYYTGRCAGPMTRCMDDCLLLMRYLAQPDARDATSLPPEVLDWSAEPLSVRGLRVGLQLDPGCGLQPDAEIRAAIEAAARLFEEHGAQLRIVEPLMDRSLLDGLNDFWRARLWSELLLLDETRRARVLPYVHAWAEGGARVSGVDAVRGFNQTFEMRRRAARLFGEIDLLLTPTNQVEAFPADWASPLNDPQRPFEHIVFTVPWNMGEQPALSTAASRPPACRSACNWSRRASPIPGCCASARPTKAGAVRSTAGHGRRLTEAGSRSSLGSRPECFSRHSERAFAMRSPPVPGGRRTGQPPQRLCRGPRQRRGILRLRGLCHLRGDDRTDFLPSDSAFVSLLLSVTAFGVGFVIRPSARSLSAPTPTAPGASRRCSLPCS